MKVTLIRTEKGDEGTFGVLFVEDEFICYTAEPPWRDNKPNVSCIPVGTYTVEPWNSKRFPNTYHLRDVPNRFAILKHKGNLAGDKSMGYLRHTLGCILVGTKRGWIGKQKAVLLSCVAMRGLRGIIGNNFYELEIMEAA